MKEIRICTNHPYSMMIGKGLLAQTGEFIESMVNRPTRAAIITDTNVGPLYAECVLESLKGYHPFVNTIPAGEEYKTPETLIEIVRSLAQHEITRSDLVIALGGGVTGDIAGFASAIYQRGIRFIQCSTTLLCAVDASVGGKTAVDLPEGKNTIGTFHQPSMVICDVDTFNTLPEKCIADGAAEIIKHAMIADADLFETMRNPSWKDRIENIVARNVEIKRSFVTGDETDHGKRQMLNFGHTIGHAIEACSRYKITHGEAVSIGMVMETRAARKFRYTEMSEERLIDVLQENHLPVSTEITSNEILQFALHDKKRIDSSINIVIPFEPGHAELKKLDLAQFKRFIEAGQP